MDYWEIVGEQEIDNLVNGIIQEPFALPLEEAWEINYWEKLNRIRYYELENSL